MRAPHFPDEQDFVFGPTNAEEEALYTLLLEGLHSGSGELIEDLEGFFDRLDAEVQTPATE
ncbi:hypothetical protein [Massilia sp. TS11]|uniref:hypothetical protein n=1 Tax=Massilia sp. TS11 TaxID=2908003 RepID=UPI001EDACBE5|nr:hypothetical protein [Massilia sp. TS11]MCG2585122.1 hypothetical protein [Massilia sp. TS11]